MRKQGLRIGFNPSSFEVMPTGKDWLVAYRGQIIYTTSTVTDAYVHTIASSNLHILRSTHTKIEYTNSRKPSTISEIGKKNLLEDVAAHLGIASSNIEISKVRPGGYPTLIAQGVALSLEVSLSHDGPWVACAYTNSVSE